jgi:hypothetical protein
LSILPTKTSKKNRSVEADRWLGDRFLSPKFLGLTQQGSLYPLENFLLQPNLNFKKSVPTLIKFQSVIFFENAALNYLLTSGIFYCSRVFLFTSMFSWLFLSVYFLSL